MALGLDQPEEDVMRRKPRSPDEGYLPGDWGGKWSRGGF